MKTSRVVLIGTLAAMAGAVLLNQSFAQPRPAATGAAAAPAGMRVAVCDVVKVFGNYQKAKDLEAKMVENRRDLKAEDDKRAKQIESTEQTLKALNPNSPDYTSTLNDLTEQTIARETWQKFQVAKEDKERIRLTEEMYREIINLAGQIAKEQGYQIVLSADETTADPNPDIYKFISAEESPLRRSVSRSDRHGAGPPERGVQGRRKVMPIAGSSEDAIVLLAARMGRLAFSRGQAASFAVPPPDTGPDKTSPGGAAGIHIERSYRPAGAGRHGGVVTGGLRRRLNP